MFGNLKRLLAATVLFLAPVFPAAAESGLTVVELFTSQACSACPPADALLGELARRQDVLALSFHVDYWDYIGWKDRFASPANTRRQKRYVERLGVRYVYTPQMVIQGIDQAVGSDRPAVLSRIVRHHNRDRLEVTLRHQDDRLVVHVPDGPVADAEVLLVAYDSRHTTTIRGGENEGLTLSNYNVVRRMERIGAWRGKAIEIPIPLQFLSAADPDGCAVLVQSNDSGEILGAARMTLR